MHKEDATKGGLTAILILQLRNAGDRTARGIAAKVAHSETGCVSYNAYPEWEQDRSDQRLNPRFLRYRYGLNPGETTSIMQIPLCDRSANPFAISVTVTAEDREPCRLEVALSENQLEQGAPIKLQPSSSESESHVPESKFHQPTSESGRELLGMILSHPVHEERGLTEILESPNGLLEVCFIPNTTARGTAHSVKKSILQPAIAELLNLGWILPPQGDGNLNIYEFNPDANKSQASG
jgi:hypothetical protein